MKKFLLHTLTFTFLGLGLIAQQPSLNWQRNIGGNADDFNLLSTQNFQGDIFISGSTNSSNNGDIPVNNGGTDIFVAKLTDSGTTVWSKNFGGSADDLSADIAPTSDGGLIILCYVNSSNGDFTQAGVWLLKLNNAGGTDFKLFYGGNPDAKGRVIQTSEGGYIFISTKTVASNALDMWVVKTNNVGAVSWQNTYGGTSNEFAADILEFNSNYYVLGESNSVTVDAQTNHGGFDLLFLKINNTGVAQWTKLYGGSNKETASKVVLDDNNEFIILASTTSSDQQVFFNNGKSDLWICNVEASGTLITNSSTGGPENDFAGAMYFNESTTRVIIAAETFSDWLVGAEPDTSNFLVAELVPFGGEQWKLVLGGNAFESPKSIVGTIDGGLLISGHSSSSNGDLTGNYGGKDFWLVKLSYPCPDELTIDGAVFTKSLSRTAENFIRTTSTFQGNNSKVKLRANYLLFEPGFQIESGTVFETQIGGCP